MKIERTAEKGIPVRANWFVTPSPQSSTYALSLLSMMCDVMYRERFGTLGFGPAPEPRITSLVPLPRFSAAWTSLSCASSGAVWAAGRISAVRARGAAARLVSRPRRERPDRFHMSATLRLLNRYGAAGRDECRTKSIESGLCPAPVVDRSRRRTRRGPCDPTRREYLPRASGVGCDAVGTSDERI